MSASSKPSVPLSMAFIATDRVRRVRPFFDLEQQRDGKIPGKEKELGRIENLGHATS